MINYTHWKLTRSWREVCEGGWQIHILALFLGIRININISLIPRTSAAETASLPERVTQTGCVCSQGYTLYAGARLVMCTSLTCLHANDISLNALTFNIKLNFRSKSPRRLRHGAGGEGNDLLALMFPSPQRNWSHGIMHRHIFIYYMPWALWPGGQLHWKGGPPFLDNGRRMLQKWLNCGSHHPVWLIFNQTLLQLYFLSTILFNSFKCFRNRFC